jgi:cephalosporin-C deacetylase-like acetyl esterase
LFNYDNTADLEIKEVGVERRGDVTIHDLSFVGVQGQAPTKAYLVVPDGEGPFAGILWIHWLGEENSNRTQFLEEAVALAPKGAISLLVDAMWSAPHWYSNRVPAEDYQRSIEQVITLRRAMDVLTLQPKVDTRRIAMVGHDYGGMYGSIMAGVDPRAVAYVLIAVTPSLNDWAFFGAQPESKPAYIRQNADLELTDYIHRVTNASFFFQFAEKDIYISRTGAAVFFAAANEPKQRKWYDADHSMNIPEAVADRDAWLIEKLGLNGD